MLQADKNVIKFRNKKQRKKKTKIEKAKKAEK
jgi:hypothetical protein